MPLWRSLFLIRARARTFIYYICRVVLKVYNMLNILKSYDFCALHEKLEAYIDCRFRYFL